MWADHQKDDGCFGLFEAINHPDLVEALCSTAEVWLFEHAPRLRSACGPLSLEPFRPAGLLVDGFDALPAAFLSYNPPYYPELVLQAGYEPGPAQHAYELDLAAAGEIARTVRVVGPDAWPTWAGVVADLYCRALPGTGAGYAVESGLPLVLVNLLADRGHARPCLESRLAARRCGVGLTRYQPGVAPGQWLAAAAWMVALWVVGARDAAAALLAGRSAPGIPGTGDRTSVVLRVIQGSPGRGLHFSDGRPVLGR